MIINMNLLKWGEVYECFCVLCCKYSFYITVHWDTGITQVHLGAVAR